MHPRRLMLFLSVLLSGCTTPVARETAAEARGYERGYQQAVKELYWLIQNRQRPAAKPENP